MRRSPISMLVLGLSLAQDYDPDNATLVTSYEVTPPIPDYGEACASQVVVQKTFADSYGAPAVVEYTPPAECLDFDQIVAEIHYKTFAYQYDRLAHVIKDGIEIWRPSTPEPLGANVTSSQQKDLTRFASLFKYSGQFELQLDNTVTDENEGTYDTEIVLNFYKGDSVVNDDSWFYSPGSPATNISSVIEPNTLISSSPASGEIPQLSTNTTRAVLNVYASGNANEEFWYTLDPTTDGPTRLVQVFVDGVLAGVVDPFPEVYTGGISPGLWQPLLGLKASDVPSYIVDISPFLPTLWSQSTTVEVAVGNGSTSNPQSIQSNWIIETSLLVWESAGIAGSGKIVSTDNSTFGEPTTVTGGFGGKYNYTVQNAAELSFQQDTGEVVSGTYTWSQNANMDNTNWVLSNGGNATQEGHGSCSAVWDASSGSTAYSREHTYPLDFAETIDLQQQVLTYIKMQRGYSVDIHNNGQDFWLHQTQDSELDKSTGNFQSNNNVYEANYHRHASSLNDDIQVDTTDS